MNNFPTTFRAHKKAQKGMTIIEILIVAAIIIGAILYMLSKVPDARYYFTMIKFQSDAATIVSGTNDWKKNRPNFDKVSITKLCTDRYLPPSICGTTNDGVSTNPFGGNWSVTVNSNKGLFDVKATFPSDGDRINQIADTMAPITRANCIDATSCSTLKKGATDITMTY